MTLHPEPVEGWCVKALPAMLRRAQHDTHRTYGTNLSWVTCFSTPHAKYTPCGLLFWWDPETSSG
jgi:hypothetical protein